MALQHIPMTEVPPRHELVRIDGNAEALSTYLQIQPPEAANASPPILAFTRKREIQIPWGEILKDLAVAGSSSIAALRKYFEESWGFEHPIDEVLDNVPDALIKSDGPVQEIETSGDAPPAPELYRTAFDDQGNPTPERLAEGVVMRHGTSGRWYLMIPKPAIGLRKDDFRDKRHYDEAWKERIGGVELVFGSEDEAKSFHTEFEDLDMRPALIERKYQELSILKDYADAVSKNVTEATQKMLESIVTAGLDAEQIEDLQQRVLRLQMRVHDVQRRREQLAAQAASLGFRLPLQDEKVNLPGSPEKTLEAGKLYRPYRRTARWTVDHTRQEIDWGLVAALAWLGPFAALALAPPKTVHEKRRYEREVTDFEPVDTARDLLSAKREALIGQGMQVFVFQQTPDGFATSDGMPLSAVMERCKVDEGFRRHCAVMLPVYEESLRGDRLVAKYSIFKRPLPGLMPTSLPRLALEESLSYRTAWRETRLGELVSAINLAPGEERKVTITKGFKQTTTVTRSSTSIFDITRAETTDLASEMEDLARQEKEDSSNLQFSTKASGTYYGISAEASASGGTTSSLKDVSQAISKVAKKAAQSVSQQNRQEVTSTSTAQTEITETDETVATIRNINQGRSLNLLFYRLHNKYHGGLYLEGLRFDVIPGVAVIEGSGVHQSRSYSLEQLPEMIQEFGPAALPFDFQGRQQEQAYTARVVDSIETLLREEYAGHVGDAAEGGDFAAVASTAGAPPVPPTSVGLLRLPPRGLWQSGLQEEAADVEDRAGRRLAELHRMLREASIESDEPMVPENLLVASPGLYLDSVVGALASTEPYSEEMRAQEVRMRSAEVFLKESEGLYKRAMALRLAHFRGSNDGNRVIGIMPDDEHNRLILKLRLPLAADGDWHLLVDGEDMGKPAEIVGRSVTFAWDEAQAWLHADDLASRIALVENQFGHTIGFPL